MWMLLGILVVGALGGVCMAALRNVSGDVGGAWAEIIWKKSGELQKIKKSRKTRWDY